MAIKITRIHAVNVYFDYNNNTIHVCVNAKFGSSSMSYDMYEVFSQSTHPKSCTDKHLWPQNLSCGFNEIPSIYRHEKQPRNVNYALLVVCHPIHQIVSATR